MQDIIDSLIYNYGFSQEDANKYLELNKNNGDLLNEVLNGYKDDCRKSFYED